jgi:hypothetical protein
MLGNICLGMMPLEREADYSQSRDVKIYDPHQYLRYTL